MVAAMSPQEKTKIVFLHQQGVHARKISEETGRSYGAVLRLLKEVNSTFPQTVWDAMSDERKQQCINDYQRGYCLPYLQKIYGVQRERLRKELDRAGIPAPTEHSTGMERLKDCREAVIHDYTTEAIGARDLARRFGVHEGTMTVFLQQTVGLKSCGAQAGAQNPMNKGRNVDSKDRDHGRYWGRKTVELGLGRKIPKGWVVHHMNENPRDQRHSNLWLFPTSAQHGSYHAQQLDRLAAGGSVPANQTALENGGLWLPQLLVLQQSEPDKVDQLLSCTQE